MNKRILTLLLCLALLIPACLSGAMAEGAGKHLNIGWHAALETLDNVSASSWEPNRLGIVETLTRISPDLELIPWLAESWEHTDDLTWVFQIREGVKFSNGKDCDAEAVKAALMRTAETSRSKSMLNIADIVADGLTLPIKTKQYPYYKWKDLRAYYLERLKWYEHLEHAYDEGTPDVQ